MGATTEDTFVLRIVSLRLVRVAQEIGYHSAIIVYQFHIEAQMVDGVTQHVSQSMRAYE